MNLKIDFSVFHKNFLVHLILWFLNNIISCIECILNQNRGILVVCLHGSLHNFREFKINVYKVYLCLRPKIGSNASLHSSKSAAINADATVL